MCLSCNFREGPRAEIHGFEAYNGFYSDPVVILGDPLAAELGESRIDAPGDISTTYEIAVGDSFEGYIGEGDVDYIRIELTEHGSFSDYELGVVGSGEGELFDPYLELLDENGNVVASNDDFAPGVVLASVIEYRAFLSTGTYYLAVSSADGGTGGYLLGAYPDASGFRPQAQDLDRFGRVDAFLAPGDRDFYKIDNYPDNQFFTVSVDGGSSVGLSDPIIEVFRNSTLIASNEDTGLSTVSFETNGTDTYYVSVEGSSQQSAGTYQLRSMADPIDDLSTTWSLEPEFYYTQAIEPGDADWRFIDLEGGQEYAFQMYDAFFGDVDSYITIYDSNGQFIASNDDENEDSLDAYLRYTPTDDETVYVEMRDATGFGAGLYQITVTNLTAATPVDAIIWKDAVLPTDDAVKVWFAGLGDVVNDEGALVLGQGFTEEQITEFMSIFEHVSDFANISFVQTDNQEDADFQIVVGDLDAVYDSGLWGRANPQGNTFYSDGTIVLDDDVWTDASTARGGFMNNVAAHEYGHALGLAHPHDTGGGSRPMRGVLENDDLGDFNLNQIPFTIMTYNDVWENAPLPPDDLGAGHFWGFGAIDIAALQSLYGANTATRTGGDSYTLGTGAFMQTIWDAGGYDDITYGGGRDVVIDLRQAPIAYAQNGGGYVSHVVDGYSGLVIAQGVEIEQAVGGFGHDDITGNALGNLLLGRDGDDRLYGLAGNDTLDGGLGRDSLYGGSGNDSVVGNSGDDFLSGGDGNDGLFGGAGDDALYGGKGADDMVGGEGNDDLYGGDNNDSMTGGAGADRMRGDAGDDTIFGGDGEDDLNGGAGGDTISGGAGNDVLQGAAGNDILYGNLDDDTLLGSSGDDELFGGLGNDRLFGDSGSDRMLGEDGDDFLRGGSGNDILNGGRGSDDLDGGGGRDALYGEDDDDVLNGRGGNDTVYGGSGDDLVDGGSNHDVVYGNQGDDQVYGNHGNDRVLGGLGNDNVFGGIGNDAIFGEAGEDILHGNLGNDYISGGSDGVRDTFVFGAAGADYGGYNTIIDFENGIDVLDLRGLGFTDFATDIAPLAGRRDGGTDTAIVIQSGYVIHLENIAIWQLDASDFILA